MGTNEEEIEETLVWNCSMIEHLFPSEHIDGSYPASRYVALVEVIEKMNAKKTEPGPQKTVMTLRR